MNHPSSEPQQQPAAWAKAFTRFRWLNLGILTALTFVLGFIALGIQFNFSPDNLFLSKDPALAFYVDKLIPNFGAGGNFSILCIEGDVRKENVQSALVEAHERLEKQTGVQHVLSLKNAQIFSDAGGFLETTTLFDGRKVKDSRLWKAVFESPIYTGNIVSKSGQAAAVIFQLASTDGNQAKKDELIDGVQDVANTLTQKYPEIKFYVSGAPITQKEIVHVLKKDQMTFVPFTMFFMGLLLFLVFRDFRGVFLPFLATGMATVWTMGILVLLGHNINIVNNAIIILLLVIGVADGVHVVARYKEELKRAEKNGRRPTNEQEKHLLVAQVVQHMLLPCFLTTTTTAVGFLSTLVAEVTLIQDFGLEAAIGVMAAFVATILFVPSMLAILPLPGPAHEDAISKGLDRSLSLAARFSVTHAKLIGLGALALTGGLSWLATQVETNIRFADELPATAPSMQALRFTEKHFTGALPFDVVFEGPRDLIESPESLRAQSRVSEYIRGSGLPFSAFSYADVYEEMGRIFSADGKAEKVRHWTDEKIAQVSLLMDMGDAEQIEEGRKRFYSQDGSLVRITALGADIGSKNFSPFRDKLIDFVHENTPKGLKGVVTGGQVIASRAMENIINDMGSSLGLAAILIAIFTMIMFRSFRLTLVALFPNLLPIIVSLAFMSSFGFPVRVSTVVIFCMALGVAVDACIHLLARLKEEMNQDHGDKEVNMDDVLYRTITGTGRPIVYTTLLLFLGFSVMGFSDFRSLRNFAILSSITLGTALVVDIALFPAMVRMLGIKKR
ncbi:MAG: hypothetical protein CMH56_10615 [Myxococcales bacterium]|nr:hypothetical protein [Myxococcales bacterium]